MYRCVERYSLTLNRKVHAFFKIRNLMFVMLETRSLLRWGVNTLNFFVNYILLKPRKTETHNHKLKHIAIDKSIKIQTKPLK